MNDWKEIRLGDVIRIKSGLPYKGEYLNKGDNYLLGMGCVSFTETFLTNGARHYSDEGKPQYIGKPGDIVLATRQQSDKMPILGMPAIIPDILNSAKIIVGSNLYMVENSSDIDNKFIFWLLRNPNYINHIKNSQTGTTVRMITKKDIENFTFLCPSKHEQGFISSLLWNIQNKIETNRKINARLEEMAQAIFKSWFIDFTPFGGQMPEEWEEKSLINMVEIVKGGDWGKEEELGSYVKRVLCIRGADLKNIKVGEKGNAPTRYILEKNFNQKYLSNHDIIVEISGGSPTQSTGRIAMISSSILDENDNSIVCTNFCKALKIKKPYYFYFYYLWNYLYDNKIMFIYENGSNGIKNLNLTNLLERENHPIPSEKIALDFYNMVESIFIKIQNLGKESARLAELRDTILPKLMSGEIKV